MRLARTASPLPRYVCRRPATATHDSDGTKPSLGLSKGSLGNQRVPGFRGLRDAGIAATRFLHLREIWPAGIEPAVSGAQSRRGPVSLRPVVPAPPAGLEPAASGSRARRHRLSTTRAWVLQLRRQGSNLRFASNSRASCRSTTPERPGGGSRIRTCERLSPSAR